MTYEEVVKKLISTQDQLIERNAELFEARQVLLDIASEDYRGPMPAGRQKAIDYWERLTNTDSYESPF